MKNLIYGKENSVRFLFPVNWGNPTDGYAYIYGTDGYSYGTIGASLTTPTALAEDASIYDRIITVTEENAFSARDWVSVQKDNSFSEHVEVKSVDGYNLSFETELTDDHKTGAAVRPRFYDISLDLTDTEKFPKNKQLIIIWGASGPFPSVQEMYLVGDPNFGVNGLEERFTSLYPREARALFETNRFYSMVDEAKIQLTMDLAIKGFDLARLSDSNLAVPTLMAKIRQLTLLGSDDLFAQERETAGKEYERQFSLLLAGPVWIDANQDQTKNDNEVTDHGAFFERGF